MDVAETYYANSSYSHIEAMTAGYFVKLSSGFEGANFGITDAMHNATMNFLFYLSHTERQCEKKTKKPRKSMIYEAFSPLVARHC
ncbi:MAG: hypothetical protein RSB86_06590 [Comamonas sp.]|uniref:hypothetical protein n=1 Tax=Comamonas sp. TaxID=34028 RepID=UPI000F938CB6